MSTNPKPLVETLSKITSGGNTASELRGLTIKEGKFSAHDAALLFGRMYPLGSSITVKEFDEFAIKYCGIAPPTNTEKGSEGWLAFMQRRHQTKSEINNAASHPRMIRHGARPFIIEQGKGAMLVVREPHEAIIHSNVASKVGSVIDNQYTKLRYLMESIDFGLLPPETKGQVRALVEHIDDYKAQMDFSTSQLSKKFYALGSEIRHYVKIGAITPKNGAIAALLEDQSAE